MQKTIELPVNGMDCAECTLHVKKAISTLPGVASVEVFLASEKAVIQLDPEQADLTSIRKAVEGAGYSIPQEEDAKEPQAYQPGVFTRQVLLLFGIVFGFVLFIVVAGEWLGLIEAVTRRVPFPIGLAIVLAGGYPVFRNVVRAALQRQVIAHTLMTMGVMAALVIGEWATAAVIVFFMRAGDYAERFTAERARRAVKDLTAMAPQAARIERDGVEVEIPASQVQVGETVIVRPGEKIPVDGEVTGGQATVDQAAITGESMPVEAGVGARVYAASIARLGSLQVRTTHTGPDTTFGRVIKLVEEAEAHRADVQRLADRFSAYYLPLVAAIAGLTFLIRRDPLSTAAVLVVACSCSFALATPIAMLASIGAGAKRGLLIKGGKYLETLARADVLLIDKTGTLTLGRPQITDIIVLERSPVAAGAAEGPVAPVTRGELLSWAASAERYSEHPLAQAVRVAAHEQVAPVLAPQEFDSLPGMGVRARLNGSLIEVGNRRMMSAVLPAGGALDGAALELEQQGKSILFVARDGEAVGLLAAADTLRPEVPSAIAAVMQGGIRNVELLTGDNHQAAMALMDNLIKGANGNEPLEGLRFRASLLPEDKIEIVREYQQRGHTVIMVGDGVNDAPALAQADVGIAMGAAGTDIAIEAAHVALMRDDWNLVPELLQIARRTMGVVKGNIAFTAVYNLAGLSLAALGFLPPIFAAAAQSLPDLGILANSSRLLRQK